MFRESATPACCHPTESQVAWSRQPPFDSKHKQLAMLSEVLLFLLAVFECGRIQEPLSCRIDRKQLRRHTATSLGSVAPVILSTKTQPSGPHSHAALQLSHGPLQERCCLQAQLGTMLLHHVPQHTGSNLHGR